VDHVHLCARVPNCLEGRRIPNAHVAVERDEGEAATQPKDQRFVERARRERRVRLRRKSRHEGGLGHSRQRRVVGGGVLDHVAQESGRLREARRAENEASEQANEAVAKPEC